MKETDKMFTASSIYTDSGAWLANGATLVSALALVALHFLSPQFDPSWRMVSEYANGNHRWVLTVVFLTWALGSFALAFALLPSANGWVGTTGLLFLVLAGVGQAMGGLFDINHRLHGAAFAIGVPALPIAAILLTIAARRAGLDVPIWAAVLPILSVAVMAVSMAMLFTSLKAAGITMSADSQPLPTLPDGISAWNGWANRLVFGSYYLWVILAGRAVLTRA
jgi:peptidoglycan/LPS O-acetylase OafA/YrhL